MSIPAWLREDSDAKSLSYYARSEPNGIDNIAVDWLIGEAERVGRKTARISLHSGPFDRHHQMLIVQYRDHCHLPHKHANKGESISIVRGELGFFAFADDGRVVGRSRLGNGHGLIARCGAGQYHSTVPVSDPVVYLESKAGTYEPGDSIHADFSPTWDEPELARTFLDALRASLDE
jgi:cupin fold WbuC family metalloprotein